MKFCVIGAGSGGSAMARADRVQEVRILDGSDPEPGS